MTRTIVAPVLYGAHTDMLLEEIELDEPRQEEVLVRMVASGVCHSCLHVIDGSLPGVPMPLVLGDEGAGIVEAAGPGVTGVAPGDHVIISWAPACGHCRYCAAGRPAICEHQPPFGYLADGTTRMRRGGTDIYHYGPATYAPEIVVPESCAVKIRDDMPLDKAALIGCAVMTGVGAVINTASVPAGASLAVFGCGGIGLNAVQGGVLAAAHPIIAVDVLDTKLAFAEQLGATHGLRGDQDDVVRRIRQITGRGVDFAIVAVGSGVAVRQAWDSLAPGGTCVMLGVLPPEEKLCIEPSRLYAAETRLIGSRYGSARPFDDFPRLVDLYLAGKLHLDELITRRYPLSGINEAHRALAAGENARGLLMY